MFARNKLLVRLEYRADLQRAKASCKFRNGETFVSDYWLIMILQRISLQKHWLEMKTVQKDFNHLF